MASLTKTTVGGKASFRLQFTAGAKRRTLYLGKIRETEANKIKAMIEDLVTAAKLKYRPDPDCQKWILEHDFETIEKLAEWQLLCKVADVLEQRRQKENPEAYADQEQRPTVLEFCQWYIRQRKSDCEISTLKKIRASLNQLCDYVRDHETIETVDDLTAEMAFRYQRKRLDSKKEATVCTDIKLAKTAFRFAMKAGKVKSNPFEKLKPGSDVNEDGQHIVPISDYEKLIDACPDSTWRAILALGRLGGLRCPSELTHLKWTDVNWSAGTLRITSPKTKRYGKPERTIPLFDRLRQELSDHFELTGETSEYVIDREPLRRKGASLSTRFNEDIREKSGVAKFPRPMPNMRLSAANDVSRLPGITPKNIVDWFGHDMATALKHYHRTTQQDFDNALSVDPFKDQVMVRSAKRSDVKSDARTPDNGRVPGSRKQKTPRNVSIGEHIKGVSYPARTRT